MKNFRSLCANTVLVLYALLAGASIDDNGDFEGWFIALCIIVPIVIIILSLWASSSLKKKQEEGRRKIPKTYILEYSTSASTSVSSYEFYYDSQNKKVLILTYDTSEHKIIEIPNIDKTTSFQYSNLHFVVDKNNKQLLIIRVSLMSIAYKILYYDEIQGVDISEDGTSVFNKSTSSAVGRAVVGGLLFGGVGAVVGGVTGKSKEKKTLNSYKVTIQLSNISDPIYEIEFVSTPIESGTTLGDEMIKQIKTCANQLKSVLTAIIKANEIQLNLQQAQAQAILQAEAQKQLESIEPKALQEHNSNSSIADELLKLSELHKNGVLTDEEYETLKKKLL